MRNKAPTTLSCPTPLTPTLRLMHDHFNSTHKERTQILNVEDTALYGPFIALKSIVAN